MDDAVQLHVPGSKYGDAASHGVTERLAAVERALTDDETAPADLSDPAAVESRLDALETRLDAFEERLADVEGDIAAVRGYVGAAERVDRETEQTAQRALATARELEARLDDETPAPREREQSATAHTRPKSNAQQNPPVVF